MTPNYILKTEKAFPNLTKGLQTVANALLNDPIIFAILPAKRIGKIIGVSETMIIRFCNSIGYDGFSKLKKDVRKHMININQNGNSSFHTQVDASNNFARSVETDIKLLQENLQKINTKELDAIAETIIKSKKVIIAGYYQSFAFAYWLYFNLTYIIENACLYRPESDLRLLETTSKGSCIIVFSFYRYALDTIRFIEKAKERNLKVITITDSRVSPSVPYADHTILIDLKNSSILRKGPVTLSVVNAIMHELVNRVDNTCFEPPTYKYFIKDGDRRW